MSVRTGRNRRGGRRRPAWPQRPARPPAGTTPTAAGAIAAPPRPAGSGVAPRPIPARGGQLRLYVLVGILLAGAVALWAVALAGTDPAHSGGLGLLDAFPPAYYAAVGLVLAAVVASLLWSPLSRLACWAGLGTLLVMVYGTPALVYSEPEYPWVYKHIGVIKYIQLHGATNRSIDIYQNWPGLFSLNAWLASATGMDPQRYVAWAPVVFDAFLLAAILYALGGVVSDPRRRCAIAFVWILGSWIGQDYLSPQALTIVMTMALIGVVLRVGYAGGWDRPARFRVGRAWERLRVGAHRRLCRLVRAPWREPMTVRADERPGAARERAVAMWLIALLGAAIITSHQLTPGVLILDLIVVVLLTGWRRLWPVIAGLAVAEILWIVLAWPIVSKFGLFSVNGPVSPQVTHGGSPMPALAIVQDASRFMGIAFWLLTAAGLVRMLRRRGTDPRTPAPIIALAVSPYLVVPVQSYGGEASLRAYLFSLPWMALMAVEAIWPSGVLTEASRAEKPADTGGFAGARRRPWQLAILAPVLAAGLLTAYYGYGLTNWMTPADVAAITWVEQHVPAGAVVYPFSGSYPGKLTARYPEIDYYGLNLTDPPDVLTGLRTPGERANAVRQALTATGAGTTYLVITPSMRNYDRLHGIMPQADIDATIAELLAAKDFTLVFRQAGAYVFKYTPA